MIDGRGLKLPVFQIIQEKVARGNALFQAFLLFGLGKDTEKQLSARTTQQEFNSEGFGGTRRLRG